ncbi:MAG: helix-turn-helix transcriptional regulator [Acidimicrobiales bacterium]
MSAGADGPGHPSDGWTPGLHLPFVGRERELSILESASGEARTGRGWSVVVAGEQGSGKSRLLEEYADQAVAMGATILRGRAFDADGTPPFWMWRTMVETLASASSAGLELFSNHESRDLLGQMANTGPPTVHPSSRLALHHRLSRLFLDVGRMASPLVILLDDLHWADRASVEFFSYLARITVSSSVLLIGSFCPEEAESDTSVALTGAIRSPNCLRLDLGPLRFEDVVELLEPGKGRSETARQVVAATGGNAFLVTEVLRQVGGISGRLGTLHVPPSVQSIVASRLAALGAEAGHAIEAAAVIGRRGSLDILAAVCTDPSAPGDLTRAIQVGLLQDVPDGFAFRHALVRQAILERLLPTRRADLEAAAARALAELGSSDDLWSIALHLTFAARVYGSLRSAALSAWERAARHASNVNAHSDAARHLEEAVSLATEAERPYLLVELGRATLRAGRPAAAQAHFEAASVIAIDADLLAAAALGYEDACLMEGGVRSEQADPSAELLLRAMNSQPACSPNRASLAAALARATWYSGGPDARLWLDRADEALDRADDDGRMRVAFARRVLAGGPGHAAEAAEACTRLAGVALILQRRDVVLDAMRQRILSLVELGALEDADDEIERFERLVHRWQEALFLPYPPLLRAMRMLHRGDFRSARRLNRRVVELSEHLDSFHTAQMALMQRFALARWTGSTARFPQDLLAFAGDTGSAPVWYIAAALAEAENGQDDLARKHLARALGPGATNQLPRNEWFLMGTGMAALACWRLGDSRRAAVLYEDLMPFHHLLLGNVAPFFGLVAHPAAVAALAAGRHADAAALLNETLRRSHTLGCPPFVVEAQRAMAHLQAVPESGVSEHLLAEALAADIGMGPTSRTPGRLGLHPELSPREREVLRHVAEGRSNEEIATLLYISYRTVKTHVSSILRKLGARDRTQAAMLAHNQQSAEERA